MSVQALRTLIPNERLNQSVFTTLCENVNYDPNTPAFVNALSGTVITYGEFLHEVPIYADGFFALLQDRNIFTEEESNATNIAFATPGQTLGFSLAAWACYAAKVVLASLKASALSSTTNDALGKCQVGIIAVRDTLPDHNDAKRIMANINNRSDVKVVIVAPDNDLDDQSELANKFHRYFPDKHIIALADVRRMGETATAHYFPRDNDIMVEVATTGTMNGESKFAQNTHLAFNCITNGYFSDPMLLPKTLGDPMCSTLDPDWLTGLGSCGFFQTISGYSTILEPRGDIDTIVDTIIRYKCARWFASQGQMLSLIKRPDLIKRLLDESCLELIYSGGEPMWLSRLTLYSNAFSNPEIGRSIMIFPAYGMTENASIVGKPVPDAPIDPKHPNILWCQPMSHVNLRVVNPATNQEVPDGTVGMLQIERNPCSSAGYAGDPELTAKAWTPDGRWFITGDAGIMRKAVVGEDNTERTLFASCGRYDHNFIGTDGNIHWAFEAEAAVQALPQVLDVVGVPDKDSSHGTVVHVVPINGEADGEVALAIVAALKALPFNCRVRFYKDQLPVKDRAKRDIRYMFQHPIA